MKENANVIPESLFRDVVNGMRISDQLKGELFAEFERTGHTEFMPISWDRVSNGVKVTDHNL